MRWQNLLSIGLIVVVVVLLGWLSHRYELTTDWTYGNRASLTHASRRVLGNLDAGHVQLTAFVAPGAARDRVRARLAPYLRASNKITLDFVDPAKHPARLRRLGITHKGVVRITYQGRSETLRRLREPVVSRALQRLSGAHKRHIVFLTGHGERRLSAGGPGGYAKLAAALNNQGLATRQLSLTGTAAIPDNTSVLVIASPQSQMLPGEVDMIRGYLAHGGNLLWLSDPGPRHSLRRVADTLGIDWLNGTLVYPDYRKLRTGHPAMALVTGYPDSAMTNHINQLTLFPFAGALQVRKSNSWDMQPILRSATRSWLETEKLKRGTLTYQPDRGDRRGPLLIGAALTRDTGTPGDHAAEHQQRVVVIADSDFMTNQFINTLGNHKLAMAVFQWLAHRDAQIGIDLTGAPDDSLQLAPSTTRSLWYIFVVLLPVSLLVIGIGRWIVRRRR